MWNFLFETQPPKNEVARIKVKQILNNLFRTIINSYTVKKILSGLLVSTKLAIITKVLKINF